MDYLAEALAAARRDFVRAHPYHFLVSDGQIERPEKPGKTASFDLMNSTVPGAGSGERRGNLLLFAVRKVIGTFPNMITMGRTANNDIVVADVSISRFHAWFQRAGEGYEIGDAGSKNGTLVNGEALRPRGALVACRSGDRIRVGRLELTFVDAGGAWDAVDRRR